MDLRFRFRIPISFLLFGLLSAGATDPGADLLNAASRGQTDQVRTLLEKGAPREAKDKDGRTALMLAAQHGYTDTVSLLLSKGADAGARDTEGFKAYGLAYLSKAKGREKVLSLLPAPPPTRVVLEAAPVLDKAFNSCFMTPHQLAERIREVQPESMVLAAVRDVASGTDKRILELVASGGDAVFSLRVRPEAMCVLQQSADNLQMEIDARLVRNGSDAAVWQKTYGGGLKGLKARVATSPVQYAGAYEEWAKAEAPSVFAGLVAAVLKTGE